MFSRSVVVLAVALCAAPLGTATAQQAADSARVTAPAVAATEASRTESPGPRVSSPVERITPTLAPRDLTERSPIQEGGRRHVFAVSTLALVLGVIIIVLLIR